MGRRLACFLSLLVSCGALGADWTVSVDEREGLPTLARGGANAFSSTFSFWGGNWSWAAHSSAFRVRGPYHYVANGGNALVDLDLTATRPQPEQLQWSFHLRGKPTSAVIGGGITFKFDTRAYAQLGQPRLLPENRGWSWGQPRGPRVTLRFDPPLASLEWERRGSELRAFFFKGRVPREKRYVATLEMSGGVALAPSRVERFGLDDPGTWPSDMVDWSASPVDLSFLNAGDRPAGRRGFLKAEGERLVFEDGTPARFWGTNLSGAALFLTTRENVRRQARRLATLGFNLVRLHHHDSHWVNPNVFGDRAAANTSALSAQALGAIDWWIKCLKDEGIYVWLDLNVQRHLRAGDGIDGFDEIRKGKAAADLKGYNYVNASIQRAMKRFNEQYLNRRNPYTGLAYAEEPAIVALLVTNENDVTRHFANALLPDKNVPRHTALYMSAAEAFARATGLPRDKVWRSWENGPSKIFLNDLERRFGTDMIAHLRALGMRTPVATTSTWGGNSLASLPALLAGDFVDVHSYGTSGELEKDPAHAATLVHWMAAARVSGRPLTVSEWNVERFPVPDRHTIPLYVAASAGHQGWAAVLQYAYAQAPLNSEGGASNWHAFNDPALLGTLPAAALLYRRADVQEARRTYAFAPTRQQLFDRSLSADNSRALRTAAEKGKLVVVLPGVEELDWMVAGRVPPEAEVIRDPDYSALSDREADAAVSDTGELRRSWREGTYAIDTPRTQAALGWIGGKRIALPDVELNVTTRNASVAVQSLDDRPIASAGAILVSLGARSVPQPSNRLPFHSEPVEGEIAVRGREGMRVYARGKSGAERAIPFSYAAGRYQIPLDRAVRSYWLVIR